MKIYKNVLKGTKYNLNKGREYHREAISQKIGSLPSLIHSHIETGLEFRTSIKVTLPKATKFKPSVGMAMASGAQGQQVLALSHQV